MRRALLVSAFLSLLILTFPMVSVAKIGVGIGTGKIQVNENLKPGTIYQLPPLSVINTGDEPSDYDVTIAFNEGQKELKPNASWFYFSPSKFHLNPGEVQVVSIKLNLPTRMVPGNYFAYLEADPLTKVQSKTTSIGVAAAAKLYFKVVPASFLEGIYYRALSLWKIYLPWSQWAVIVLATLVILGLGKKFLNIQINFKRPSEETETEDENKNE